MDRVRAQSCSGSRARRWGARTCFALVTVLTAVAVGVLALAPSASSQPDPVARAGERLASAQADVDAVRDRYAQAVAEREQAQVKISELEQTIPEMGAQERHLRSELARRAVALYKNSDATSRLGALGAENRMDAGRRAKFSEVAGQLDEQGAQELRETADRLQQVEAELRGKRTELDDLVARLERDRVGLDEMVARAQRGLEIAEQHAPLRAVGEPLMGPSVLSAAELVAWYRSSGGSPRLSGDTSIEQLAQMFIDEGAAENVRGDFAFAQAYIETGGFRAGGVRTTSRASVPATDAAVRIASRPRSTGFAPRFKLLRNYADSTSRAAALVNPP
jgi:hypothetical protein